MRRDRKPHRTSAAAAGDSASRKTISNDKQRIKVTEVEDTKRYSRRRKKIPKRCPLLTISNQASTSTIPDTLEYLPPIDTDISDDDDDYSSIQSDVHVDACGFPYYRSWCNGRKKDAVLVKDACVSCTILAPTAEDASEANKRRRSKVPSLESKLLSQIKTEYNDLSSITRKISAYTKDIITSLATRTGRKSSVMESVNNEKCIADEDDVDMQPIAMQYFDKSGRPCLKLRLRDSRASSKINNQRLSSVDKNEQSMRMDDEMMQRIFSDSFHAASKTSSNCSSSSSIYNYLMFNSRRRKLMTIKANETSNTPRISEILSQ